MVSTGLASNDDPQQIFESLNPTDRPLTASQRIKNWLLIGLPDEEQQDLHDNHWKQIERSLGAEHTTEPTDTFLPDVLRWRTGKAQGIDHVYEALRRWAVRQGRLLGTGWPCAAIWHGARGFTESRPARRVCILMLESNGSSGICVRWGLTFTSVDVATSE